MTPRCYWVTNLPRVSWAAAPVSCPFDGTPAAPDFIPTAVVNDRAAASGGGGGTERDQPGAVSGSAGLVREPHPGPPRPPPDRPEGGNARRPAPPMSRA